MLILSQLPAAYASVYEPTSRIEEVTKNFVLDHYADSKADRIEVKVNPSHAPIQVAECTQPIIPSLPQNSAASQISSVELTCNGDSPWHIYIPVTVQSFNQVIVAKSTILPNELIKEEDLDYGSYDTNRLYSGYYKNKADLVNNVTTGLIPAGHVLSKKDVTTPTIVHRNQVVSLISGTETILVSMQGIAKADGGMNATIQVYNPISKKVVDAVIVGPGKARAFG